jgi:hypothetical protein
MTRRIFQPDSEAQRTAHRPGRRLPTISDVYSQERTNCCVFAANAPLPCLTARRPSDLATRNAGCSNGPAMARLPDVGFPRDPTCAKSRNDPNSGRKHERRLDLRRGQRVGVSCPPSGGAVNARRPRSGRSAATSIDGAEHGDMLPTRDGRAQEPSASDISRRRPTVNCGTVECLG